MANKLDMSLDDIIQQSRTQGGRGRGSPRRGRGRGGQNRSRRDSNSRDDGNSGGGQGVLRGGVNQNRRRGGRGGSFNQRSRETPDVWQHDLYEESSGPARTNVRNNPATTSGSGKLLVSNLEFGVSDSDIQELFTEFGPLVKAAVHFDRSGRSLGTAEVIYQRNSDAAKALKQYNNVPLDGRPMSIQLVGAPPFRSVNSRLGSRVEDNKPTSTRGNFRGGNRGERGRGGRGRDKKLPTVEDLDAQLDAYNAKMEVD